MVVEIVEVGLVLVQVVIAENMNFVVDYAGIVDKERFVVGIGMVVGMDDFHKHILTKIEEACFGSTEEAKISKA
jgi:hypothetical protein